MSGLVQKVLDNEMGDEVLHVYHPPTPLLGQYGVITMMISSAAI